MVSRQPKQNLNLMSKTLSWQRAGACGLTLFVRSVLLPMTSAGCESIISDKVIRSKSPRRMYKFACLLSLLKENSWGLFCLWSRST